MLDCSYNNSFPEALNRVSQIALQELGPNASEQDKADSKVQVFKGDLKSASDVQAIFDHYNKEGSGIWGVIHVAALKAVGESGEKPIEYYQNNISATISLLDVRPVSIAAVSYRRLKQHMCSADYAQEQLL